VTVHTSRRPDLTDVLTVVIAGRDRGERECRLSDEVVAALAAAGLFRLGVPAALGGPGHSALEVLDVIETVTAADASAGWCVWNNLLPVLFSQRLPADVRVDVLGDERTVYGVSTRASGELAADGRGGYRLSGRWSLVSGCRSATMFALLGVVTVDGEPLETTPGVRDLRLAFVPASAVEIVDTWSSGGLRGSGSHDVLVDDIAIPDAHACRRTGPAPGWAGSLDGFPTIGFMAAGAATMLGALGAVCVDALVDIAAEHVPTDGRTSPEARPAVVGGLARAAGELGASRLAVRSAVDAISATALDGAVPAELRATLMEAVATARRLCLDAIRSLYELGGTASVYTTRPLERAHRDAHVIAQHVIFDGMWAEQAGRVRLGLAPTNPLF
jgi:alkylation response protein AidB-like acyl-CoA dehydrogenase